MRCISFDVSTDISKIFKAFFNCNLINAFSHSRAFKDGSRAELWTDAQSMEYTFCIKKYTTSISHAPDLYKKDEKYFFLKDKVETFSGEIKKKYKLEVADQANHFNHDNTFVIQENNSELATDFFCFYCPKKHYESKVFIINNLMMLESFLVLYKEKAKYLIKAAEEDRLVKPRINLFFGAGMNLTNREKEVARLLSYGLTYREVADQLNKSTRTIEDYSTRLQDKYSVTGKKNLVEVLRSDFYIFGD